ncbi:hypothetical protein H0A36_12630 [Endozoicomonas sp. SM1973]|uniref:Uncharacterized protein n=1 Tax=Spartinivicinus marinus TaxID=2994442 RepID=A0A853I2N0_9GAMM|nr:hypothetical protein [Spartinivicinus marinus]MCX4026487.1 hypothetical protein [Spartinivicinus marinus]NYZ66859.1 hypothetical protein [Spartinivicinus marinus]
MLRIILIIFITLFSITSFAEPPKEYQWTQGRYEQEMGLAAFNVCYLTGIKGVFESRNEIVRVYQNNGKYYLGGASRQQGVGGWAMCVGSFYGSSSFTAFNWLSSQGGGTQMVPSNTHRCFLSGLAGAFNSSQDQVSINRMSNSWVLGGNTTSQELEAWAGCVKNPLSIFWTQTFTWHHGSPEVVMTNANDSMCFLHSVKGKFDAFYDWVRIAIKNGKFVLSGSFFRPGVSATAVCTPRLL